MGHPRFLSADLQIILGWSEIFGIKIFISEQSMRVPRDGHTSVVQGEYIIHIGGNGDKVRASPGETFNSGDTKRKIPRDTTWRFCAKLIDIIQTENRIS